MECVQLVIAQLEDWRDGQGVGSFQNIAVRAEKIVVSASATHYLSKTRRQEVEVGAQITEFEVVSSVSFVCQKA